MSDLSASIHDLVDEVFRASGFEPAQADGYSEPSNLRCESCHNFRRAVPAHRPDCPKAWKNCPGCTGNDPAGRHLASCPLSAGVPKSVLALTPFNLAAALKGDAFIHRLDASGPSPAQHVSRDIRMIEHPEHPAYLVWSGEWIPYPMNDEGLAEMEKDFFMVDLSPYRPKSAVCMHCGQPIVQWWPMLSASYVHVGDQMMFCGVGLDMHIAAPAPGSVIDPNSKAVR